MTFKPSSKSSNAFNTSPLPDLYAYEYDSYSPHEFIGSSQLREAVSMKTPYSSRASFNIEPVISTPMSMVENTSNSSYASFDARKRNETIVDGKLYCIFAHFLYSVACYFT